MRRLRLMKGEAQATGEGDGSDYSDRDRQLFSHWFYSDFFLLVKVNTKVIFLLLNIFS